MSFILPNWIPRDITLLEGCINEEMKRLNELQEEIARLESKSFNPFAFKTPNQSIKLPCPMTIKLINTLIYKTKIVDYDFIYSLRIMQPPILFIATPHEIHYFPIPISKNNPAIKIPVPNIEIVSMAVFSDLVFALFNNNEIVPYSLTENSWKAPIEIPFGQPINVMKKIKNHIFLQTGPNRISLFDSSNYQIINTKNLNTKTILESYFSTDSNNCYFKTIEKEVIIVDVESMRVIHTVSLAEIFICKLAIQSYGNFIFAYNDEITLKYDPTFKLAAQLEFGSTYMYAETNLIFFLSETAQSSNDTQHENQSNSLLNEKSNFTEEEDNDIYISLSIASIQTKEVLATLSISKINIVSFKVLFTKPGERCIIIQGDDNSLSFWNFTFEIPQKDDHGRIIIQKVDEEDRFKHQQIKQLAIQNNPKLNASRKASIIPPSLINNQKLSIINAPISPVNQATSVHLPLPTTNDKHGQFDSNQIQQIQANHITAQKVRLPQQYQQFTNQQIIATPSTTIHTNNINSNNSNDKKVQIHKFNSLPPSQITTRSQQLKQQIQPQIKQQKPIPINPQIQQIQKPQIISQLKHQITKSTENK